MELTWRWVNTAAWPNCHYVQVRFGLNRGSISFSLIRMPIASLPKRIHLIHTLTHTNACIHARTHTALHYSLVITMSIHSYTAVWLHTSRLLNACTHTHTHTLSFNCPSVKRFSIYFHTQTRTVPLVHSSIQTPHGVNLPHSYQPYCVFTHANTHTDASTHSHARSKTW